MKQASGMKCYGSINVLLFIVTGSKACGSYRSTYRYSPGGPPREADTNPYWNYEYPPPPGWYETKTWPQSPYRFMDYIQFMKEYKKYVLI